jgi:AcrR family transcriptional regulator
MKRPNLFRGERPPRAPKQRRSLRRRDAILRAALVRFGREGYEGASIRGIANEANVATGAVYQFFRSKRHLLLVSMDTLLRRLETVGAPSFAGRETLLEDLEGFLADVFSRERPFIGVYRAWQEAALIDATIAAHDRRIRAWSSARIRNLFLLLVRLPGARSGQDVAILARLWDRFFWNLLARPPSDRRRAVRSIAATLYHTLFSDARAG